jgi:hypothetical protein
MQPVLPVDMTFTWILDMEWSCRFIHFALCSMRSIMFLIYWHLFPDVRLQGAKGKVNLVTDVSAYT